MRFKDMTPEQHEKAKNCETAAERVAFLEENGIELTDEQLEGIAGGEIADSSVNMCPAKNYKEQHKYVHTGQTRPGDYFGDWWPDKEYRCEYCGHTYWS